MNGFVERLLFCVRNLPKLRYKGLQGDQKKEISVLDVSSNKYQTNSSYHTWKKSHSYIIFQFQPPQKFMMTDETQLNHYQILFMRHKQKIEWIYNGSIDRQLNWHSFKSVQQFTFSLEVIASHESLNLYQFSVDNPSEFLLSSQ